MTQQKAEITAAIGTTEVLNNLESFSAEEPLLEVKNLSLTFRQYMRGLRQSDLKVISDLSVSVRPGELLAIVGSSGSGKSLLAHAIMGILPGNAQMSGEISYKGEPLDESRLKVLRGREMALIPQSVSYLDPLMKVGEQVKGTRGSEEEVEQVFDRFGLRRELVNFYPFQLSGGMARRVLVATAVVDTASLIIADEPTPGLTHELAFEALRCFRELADSGAAVILITHDLTLAAEVCDTIAVFYAGTTVEIAPATAFVGRGDGLKHPYTRALWHALPQNGFKPIEGAQPYAGDLPEGCLFHPRCLKADLACQREVPSLKLRGRNKVRCIHVT